MSNFFKNAHMRAKNSPAIIVIWLVLATAFVIACLVAYEDYSTSLLGYSSIPTQKANEWIVVWVALMPQVIQIVLFFNFLTDTDNKRWSLFAAIVVHFVDVGLDVYYKSSSFDSFGLTVAAFIESELIYTFGSEVLLTMSFGLMIATLPDFIMQSRAMFHNIVDAISNERGGGGSGKPFSYGDRGMGQPRSPMPHMPDIDEIETRSRAQLAQMRHAADGKPVKFPGGAVIHGKPGGVVKMQKPGVLDKILKRG